MAGWTKIPSLVFDIGQAASKSKPFYSPVDRAINEITQGKGTGEQFLGMILNKKGVKPQEIKDRGLDKLLKGKMTKEDVQRIAAENPPPAIRERVLRGPEEGSEDYSLEFDEDRWVVSDPWGMPKKSFDDEDEALEFLQKMRSGEAEHDRDGLTIPGGENYREILLKLPTGYRSAHFGQEGRDVLAHARVSDRTGPSGEKVLHIEEIQSDLHQQGRKYGYKLNDFDRQIDELKAKHAAKQSLPERMKLMEQIQDIENKQKLGAPDAPFKANWHELVMKRLLDDAARNGYDRVVITPGAEQAKRYPDESKAAEDVLRGFAGFYDEKLPLYLNKYGEKWGAKVQPNAFIMEGAETPLHSFDITPQMREEIVVKGQPLYQVAPPAIGAGALMEPEQDQNMKRGGAVKKCSCDVSQDAMQIAVMNKRLKGK